MSNNIEKGYVFIFTNESFRDDVIKIGMSTKPIEELIKDLYCEDLPTPYDAYAIIKTVKYETVLKIIYWLINKFTNSQCHPDLDFFNLSPVKVLEVFLGYAELIDDAVVIKYVDGEPCQIYPSVEEQQPLLKETPDQE